LSLSGGKAGLAAGIGGETFPIMGHSDTRRYPGRWQPHDSGNPSRAQGCAVAPRTLFAVEIGLPAHRKRAGHVAAARPLVEPQAELGKDRQQVVEDVALYALV